MTLNEKRCSDTEEDNTDITETTDTLYTQSAELYDAVYSSSYYREKVNQILESVVETEDETVLDVGCGTGQLPARLEEYVSTVIATDVSPQMISLTKELHSGPTSVANIKSLPVEDSSVDIVTIVGDVIGYVDSLDTAFTEVNRVLKEEGRVFISYFKWPITESKHKLYGSTRNGNWVDGTYCSEVTGNKEMTVTFTFNIGEDQIVEPTTLNCYTKQDVIDALDTAGFEDWTYEEEYTDSQIGVLVAEI